MRRSALFLTAAALVVGAANLSAQTVNFTGTWTPVVDPNAGGGGGGGGGGRGGQAGPMTITMDAKTMTITRTTPNGETKTVYNLDGSDSKNTMAGRNGAAGVEVISKAKLDGGKVIVATTRDFNGVSNTTTVTYWLDGGKLMTSSISNQPGRDGGAPVARVTTYTKG